MKYLIKVTHIYTDNKNVKALFERGSLYIRIPGKGDSDYGYFKELGGHLCGVKKISTFESYEMAEDYAVRNAWKWRKRYGCEFEYEITYE